MKQCLASLLVDSDIPLIRHFGCIPLLLLLNVPFILNELVNQFLAFGCLEVLDLRRRVREVLFDRFIDLLLDRGDVEVAVLVEHAEAGAFLVVVADVMITREDYKLEVLRLKQISDRL